MTRNSSSSNSISSLDSSDDLTWLTDSDKSIKNSWSLSITGQSSVFGNKDNNNDDNESITSSFEFDSSPISGRNSPSPEISGITWSTSTSSSSASTSTSRCQSTPTDSPSSPTITVTSKSNPTFVNVITRPQSYLGQVLQTLAQIFLIPSPTLPPDTNRHHFYQDETKRTLEFSNSSSTSEFVIDDIRGQQSEIRPFPSTKPTDGSFWGQNGLGLGIELDGDPGGEGILTNNVRTITARLEDALRIAKKAHLQTSQVLLPPDLLTRIARDILLMAETEPCGLRGCLINLHFESGTITTFSNSQQPISTNSTKDNSTFSNNNNNNISNNNNNSTANAPLMTDNGSAKNRKIGTVKIDSQTVTTFELNLSLREDLQPWYSRLPQILRNLTKGSIVVSPAYTIAKKKLYRSH